MENRDVLIIGAGVAGLTAGLYSARSGMKTLILDEMGGGGQVLQIDNLENYPGVFPAVKGTNLVETMQSQAKSFGAEIVQAQVSSIDKKGTQFIVKTVNAEYSGSALILASGADHSKLGVVGEKEFSGCGVSYCAVCDGPFFKNRTVVVVGGGDSACTEALYLANIASTVHVIHRRSQFRASKVVADRVLNHEKITVHFNSTVKEIKGQGAVKSVILEDTETHALTELPTDAVFIFVGMVPRTNLFEILKKDKAGYIITDEKMATAVPGLFIAGDVRSKPLRQIVTAASDGAIAGFEAAEFVKSHDTLFLNLNFQDSV